MARANQKLVEAIGLTKYEASEKKFSEAILFVHFFDGSPQLIKRHIEFVNELGFDAYAYQVAFHFAKRHPKDFIPRRTHRIGLKNFWTKDAYTALDSIEGDKIVFAFSNPASAAIEAMAKRFEKGTHDVKALVCDSGPFVEHLKCSYNLTKHYYEIKNPLINLPASFLLSFSLSPFHARHLHEDLAKFPKDFPILSVRGWKDKLVPVRAIEKVFEPHSQLDLESLILPEAGHLNGLKDFADKYKPVVRAFLEKNANALGGVRASPLTDL